MTANASSNPTVIVVCDCADNKIDICGFTYAFVEPPPTVAPMECALSSVRVARALNSSLAPFHSTQFASV